MCAFKLLEFSARAHGRGVPRSAVPPVPPLQVPRGAVTSLLLPSGVKRKYRSHKSAIRMPSSPASDTRRKILPLPSEPSSRKPPEPFPSGEPSSGRNTTSPYTKHIRQHPSTMAPPPDAQHTVHPRHLQIIPHPSCRRHPIPRHKPKLRTTRGESPSPLLTNSIPPIRIKQSYPSGHRKHIP